MILKELIQLYINDILPRKRLKTQINQKHQLEVWSEYLGEMEVKDIRAVDVVKARNLLNISDASKNVYMAALHHVFTIAIKEYDLLESNPLAKVSNLRNPRGRVRYLSDEERKEFLISCEESANPHLYLVVMLAITTGARKNEILGLTWGDIDLERKLITLHETKNGEIRTLPIVPKVQCLISEKQKELSKVRWTYQDNVFKGKKGKPIDIRHPFNEALKRAGITNFRFHDLRHTCASYLAMNGASLNEIAEILGHKSLNMVKRYAHLSTQHKASVINKMVENIEL